MDNIAKSGHSGATNCPPDSVNYILNNDGRIFGARGPGAPRIGVCTVKPPGLICPGRVSQTRWRAACPWKPWKQKKGVPRGTPFWLEAGQEAGRLEEELAHQLIASRR